MKGQTVSVSKIFPKKDLVHAIRKIAYNPNIHVYWDHEVCWLDRSDESSDDYWAENVAPWGVSRFSILEKYMERIADKLAVYKPSGSTSFFLEVYAEALELWLDSINYSITFEEVEMWFGTKMFNKIADLFVKPRWWHNELSDHHWQHTKNGKAYLDCNEKCFGTIYDLPIGGQWFLASGVFCYRSKDGSLRVHFEDDRFLLWDVELEIKF